MFEQEAAAFRLVGYLEEAMKTIDQLCDRPAPTKREKELLIIEIQRVASTSRDRAKLLS